MSEWTAVGALTDFAAGTATRVLVGQTPVAVVSTDQGLFAVSDVCSHAEVSLSEGEVDDCAIECWLHGSRFDLRTGVPSGPPATTAIATYDIAVSDDPNPIVSVRVSA
ncbi:MAG: non-heme iron oxygenase ferredoxin subunit [Actinobacteria bacterium]|nr:non-heme iron oxygenase ferredoxin subunit [Actinomycetota bacterium]